MNILIVDDHPVVRRGIRALLAEEFQDAAISEASTINEALRELASRSWALVILDLTMPGRGGLDALPEIHATYPDLPVLVLSVHAEEQYAIRALRAGAIGYVTKDSSLGELIAAARKALAGSVYVSAKLAEILARDVRTKHGCLPHEALSDREFQVLRLLARGRSVKQIGVELALSDKTISTYRTRMLEKMRMTSNAELVRYAVENGLID